LFWPPRPVTDQLQPYHKPHRNNVTKELKDRFVVERLDAEPKTQLLTVRRLKFGNGYGICQGLKRVTGSLPYSQWDGSIF
jgi:hypothetical protein